MRTIHTARLRLEPVTARNARELWTLLNAPDLRKFQDIPRLPIEEFERQVRSRPRALDRRSTGRFEWIVYADDPAIPVGWISLRVNDRAGAIGEIGYSLITAARSRGYATEAVSALVDEWFAASELQEIQACTVPENERLAQGPRARRLHRVTNDSQRCGHSRPSRRRRVVSSAPG